MDDYSHNAWNKLYQMAQYVSLNTGNHPQDHKVS